MTHKKLFAVCVKVNGKVLREVDDTVTLPFGAEYSVFIKNLGSTRALVKVSVDGQDATDGTRLIVPANGSVELERFIRNGNLSGGNKLKFIERTGAVEQHRGIGAEDGLVRVEAWAEVVAQYQPITWYQAPTPSFPPRRRSTDFYGGLLRSSGSSTVFGAGASMGTVKETLSGGTQSANFCSTSHDGSSSVMDWSETVTDSLNDAGITVPGSESTQTFSVGDYFPVENTSTVIVLKLRGAVGAVKATRPVTVEVKPKCVTCGRQNKATSKFCSTCGTALVIL